MVDLHYYPQGHSRLIAALNRGMHYTACLLAVVVIIFFSTELLTRPWHHQPVLSTYQAWAEGGAFILAIAVLIIALFARQVNYLLISALIFCQTYFGASLSNWPILQPQLLLHYASASSIQQWIIGITLFLAVYTFFRLKLLSFDYFPKLQYFLYFGSLLWPPSAWFLPASWFHILLNSYLPIYLGALCISLIAREWLPTEQTRPAPPYAYTTPILLSTAACCIAVWFCLHWQIIPELITPIGSFILLVIANLGALLAVLENLLYQKHQTTHQQNQLAHYQQLSPFGLLYLDAEGNIIYHNALFEQWVHHLQLPTPIHHWSQYFTALNSATLLKNTQNNTPTEVQPKQLNIELPQGTQASFYLFGFAEADYLIVYLIPSQAHYALPPHLRPNPKLSQRLYTNQGLEEIFNRIFQNTTGNQQNLLPNFLACLKILPPQTQSADPQDYSVPISEALQRHLEQHARTPFYIGKLSGQEFVLIMTRFSKERLNRWLNLFINHLQQEVLSRLSYGQPLTRCYIGVVELSHHLNYTDSLAVARSACETAIKNNEQSVLYEQNSAELHMQLDQLQFFEQLNQGNTRGLYLQMQPIISLKEPGASYHAEVLLRFRNNDNGALPTEPLINAAAQNGSITTIDKWVFHTTLNWFSQHYDELEHIHCLNLNLSAVSLNDSKFIHELIELLEQHPMVLSKLCIEITESVALHDLAYTRNLMHTLQNMGIKIALDDFGAGYTSFSYLRELPANALKIDGSLIKDMLRTQSNIAIVRTIVELAQNLGMVSIAEWVEDIDTLLALKELGVDYVQGFAVSKAVNPAQILDNKQIFTLIPDPVTVRYLQ